MTQFIEIPANRNSLKGRGLVFGVGINDASYIVRPIINGKKVMCPFYSSWRSMIARCYSVRLHERQSTYAECSVSSDWLVFSVFKSWMERQDWEGKDLDKDLLIPGNKVYSSDTCIFVSGKINRLLNDNAINRGAYSQGVCFRKDVNKYQSKCKVAGKTRHLGYFSTEIEAALIYSEFKANLIEEESRGIEATNSPKLKSALIRHAEIIRWRTKQANGRKEQGHYGA
jgi:hypothetical protein